MSLKYGFSGTIRRKINGIQKLDHFVNYCFSKNNFWNDSIAYVNERSTIKANISRTIRDTEMTRSMYGDIKVFFDRNRQLLDAFFPICHTVFCMFSCLQINCQPFYLHQLLKLHPSDWLIEIYLQTEGQGTHHKMVSL